MIAETKFCNCFTAILIDKDDDADLMFSVL